MRKAFNFYRSYFDVAKELSESEKLKFLWALLEKQFNGIEPILSGQSRFAYISQKHSIDSQVSGYESKMKEKLHPTDGGMAGGAQPPSVQEKGEGKEEGKEEGKSFLVFWDLYNKKQGDKLACEKKWDKLKDAEREKIFATLPNFLKNIKDKKFQPLPATYLNQKRWNDELPEFKQTAITQTPNNKW